MRTRPPPGPRKKVTAFVAVMILWALVAVLIRHQNVKLSYQVAQKRLELKQLQETQAREQTRLERLKSPARLEKLAKGKFDLASPRKDQVVVLADEE